MSNHSNVRYIRNNDTSLMFGGGLEYGMANGLALRADVSSFDVDAINAEPPAVPLAAAQNKPVLAEAVPPIYRDFGILFGWDSSVLDQDAMVVGVNIVAALRSTTSLDVRLTGYADTTGPEAYNLWLAERRVRRVKSLLEARGIASDRIDTVTVGETDFFGSLKTAASYRQNRRVQVEISSQDDRMSWDCQLVD